METAPGNAEEAGDAAPEEVEKGEGYAIASKPYTNKKGEVPDTYLVTFDRDFSREEMSALRAKANGVKGWHDSNAKGWMFRSAENAKAFAEEVMGKSEDEIADEAPLSVSSDIKPKAKTKEASISNTPATVKKGDEVKLNGHGRYKVLYTEGAYASIENADNPTMPTLRTPIDTLSPYETERPKPKKRNKWISDEDAAEYGELMDDLRRELGGGDIVEDEGAEHGNKKSPSNQRQDLTTSSSVPKDTAKLQKISEKLGKLKEVFKGKTNKTGVLTDISDALQAEILGDGPSRYATFSLPSGASVEVRISNHNANADTFARRGRNEQSALPKVSSEASFARRKRSAMVGNATLKFRSKSFCYW